MAREQRLIFGEVADAYQRNRPSYPDELYDAIEELAAIVPGDPVVDVGAGTGKATEGLVARGYRVTAVEPSPEMAAVLQARLPDVDIQVAEFEECALEPDSFAVVTAAQSWHWVDPIRGPHKASDLLRRGGWLALFWNGGSLDDCDWHDALQPIYQRIAPQIAHEKLAPAQSAGLRGHLEKLNASRLFDKPVVRRVRWVAHYTSSEYAALLDTHSDHRLLPDEQRAALHRAIAEEIDARGGTIVHPYTTELIAARVR